MYQFIMILVFILCYFDYIILLFFFENCVLTNDFVSSTIDDVDYVI